MKVKKKKYIPDTDRTGGFLNNIDYFKHLRSRNSTNKTFC